MAILAVALATLTKMITDRLIGVGPPLLLFVPAVSIAAWHGGLRPGLLATALAVLVCMFGFLDPVGTFEVHNHNDKMRLCVFVATCVLTSFLMGSLKAAQRRAESSVREAARKSDELRATTAAMIYQATHDGLTGLANRTLFQERMRQAIGPAPGREAPFALLLLDLDRFKEINDTFGHQCGDEALKQLSPRLLAAVRDTDVVARLGGDEFGILLQGADRALSAQIAERISASLHAPLVATGQTLDVGASVGIALYPEHGNDAATLLQRADLAMYAAKRARAGHATYSAEQADYTPRRLAMIGELRRGIRDDQLVLHYQPKVDLRTGRVAGAEALVRWLHPTGGLIPPGEFIPLAQHAGLIRPLGLWTLKAALLQCGEWRRSGVDVGVAVNLAPENLQDADLSTLIEGLLGSTGVPAGRLTVEVTESAMMADPARARRVLCGLHDTGMGISIDDFGTGYSSLAYLKDLPVDEVKIDREFVKDMATDERAACIVRAVIDLGHDLGMRVVAEGVEDGMSLDLLRAWGCDLAQGYHYSRPLPAAGFVDWMAAMPGERSSLIRGCHCLHDDLVASRSDASI